MSRVPCYFHSPIDLFLSQAEETILGQLAKNNEFTLSELQRNSWYFQIQQLKQQLTNSKGHIIFEYTIPRIGRRLDVVLIIKGILFAIEYKVGSPNYDPSSINQLLDYVLDLKNFHEASHLLPIVPILISSEAQNPPILLENYPDWIFKPILSNGNNLDHILKQAEKKILTTVDVIPNDWITSRYKPTPSIIEAAQALYENHSVEDISRSEAGIVNLSETVAVIENVIERSKRLNRRAICFITGVPGSGKTLAGLNIANHWHDEENEEHAVFLSGNGPLVKVLQEALARNAYSKAKDEGIPSNKAEHKRKVAAFVQNIHHFRDDTWKNHTRPPIEHVTIFDEAQRAWTLEQTAKFMKTKKGVLNFSQSEPSYLISVMDRHVDWAVIICLVGNGQEINVGEAGISEWFSALRNDYPDWDVFLSDEMSSNIGKTNNHVEFHKALHLSVSTRSFRSESVSEFVHHLLVLNTTKAANYYQHLSKRYALYVTRDLEKAKNWLRAVSRGSERYGLIASSGAKRLRPEGFNVYEDIEVENWFLNDKEDVRSSYCLEGVATEFDIQGLELDWVCVGWGADLRHTGTKWDCKKFKGTKWQNINKEVEKTYLLNAYRVLLTRARQGTIIYLPYGETKDKTRLPEFYNLTYNYLKSIGIQDLP